MVTPPRVVAVLALAGSFLVICGCTSPRHADTPDLILYGGKVFTADPATPWAEAISIRGDRILDIGSDAVVRATADAATRIIDLGGRVVIPGINDTHTHLGYGAPLGAVVAVDVGGDWVSGPAPEQVLDSLAVLVRRTPSGTWLRGQMGLGIRYSSLRRLELDSLAPEHPVILVASYGHGTMLNTRALRIIGVSETMADPVGGWYERFPGSETITGLLEGSAQYDAWDAYYSSNRERMIETLREQGEEALRYGVTTVQHMASTLRADETERVFRVAALPVRVRLIQWPFPSRRADWERLRGHRPAPLTYISGVKYVADGTPLERWALMRQPYEGMPDWYGRLYYRPDEIRRMLVTALTGEDQLMLHVVGDSTAALVFGMMGELAPDSVWQSLRVRFEHANGIVGPNVERARRLGVVTSQARTDGAQMSTWQQAGIKVGYGSDGEPGNPWNAMLLATTTPQASQALSREDALRMFTWGSAFAEFAEHEKGTLAAGMLADLAVLSQDIFMIPAEALPATVSVLTIVNGLVAYDAGVLPVSTLP